ncbi:MAG: hypothetical protein ACR2QV_04630 [Gammaproteobacteria bacterium]
MSISGSDWLAVTGSTAFHPPAEWADRLRARALHEPVAHDRGALLELFARHSDYYARRIGNRTGAAADWSRTPPLEKGDVADVPVVSPTPVTAARTSGTTGFQVSIKNNAWEREFRRALLYRPQSFYDLPSDVTQVVFVDGSNCAKPDDAPKLFEYGKQTYRTWFIGVASEPDDALQLLTALRPQLVRGISSGIVRCLECTGADLTQLGVRYVAPGGEYLRPEWRTLLENAFGADVLDRYGSTESGALAWQCPLCRRYHANVDEIVIEASNDDRGLLTTPLFVSSQPLLRYRLGDYAHFDADESDCEIRLPTLTLEAARRDDWIVDGTGNKVSPLSFQFEQVPNLDAWRLHQRADGSLVLYYESKRPREVEPLLARQLVELIADRPFELRSGVWNLAAGGKFKRVSSDLAIVRSAGDTSA